MESWYFCWSNTFFEACTFSFAFSGQLQSSNLKQLKNSIRESPFLPASKLIRLVWSFKGYGSRKADVSDKKSFRFVLVEIMSEMDDIEEFPKAGLPVQTRRMYTV